MLVCSTWFDTVLRWTQRHYR